MHILLLDDDDTSNFITKSVLKRTFKNATIKSTKTIQEMMDSYTQKEKNCPRFLFLDINLGSESGWQALELIKELKVNKIIEELPKVFMLSSSIFEDDKLKSNEYENVLSYISKPITNEKIHVITHFFI